MYVNKTIKFKKKNGSNSAKKVFVFTLLVIAIIFFSYAKFKEVLLANREKKVTLYENELEGLEFEYKHKLEALRKEYEAKISEKKLQLKRAEESLEELK